MNSLLSVGGVTTLLVLFLTVLFQYIPGLRVVWGGVKSEVKMLIVLGVYLVIGAFVAFGGCLEFLAKLIPQLECVDAPTFFSYLWSVAVAIGAGQGIFSLMPELKDVSEAKAERVFEGLEIYDDDPK
jgi:hypothetical protein